MVITKLKQKYHDIQIGPYSGEGFLDIIKDFHGSVAPGLVIGGFMVDLALTNLPEGEFFDAVCETRACLPDAIQLLTPCTIGNGWLKIQNSGRYALTMHEKWEGEGIRIYINPLKIKEWPEIYSWFYKHKPKKEQDYEALMDQILEAGSSYCSIQKVQVKPELLSQKIHGDRIVNCSLCEEPFRTKSSTICFSCLGENLYFSSEGFNYTETIETPPLECIPVEKSEGHETLHDMTQVIPGKFKGVAFKRGQNISTGDICRLQKMGRKNIYVNKNNSLSSEWIHEDEAALSFANAMAGQGVRVDGKPREGKITLSANDNGLFLVNKDALSAFNMLPGVMCSACKSYGVFYKNDKLAATRAIPLYLHTKVFQKAMVILERKPLFEILPMKKARVGIIVTGSEVFQGLIEDKFIPVITSKVEKYGCTVEQNVIVTDDYLQISNEIQKMIGNGIELIVTTGGLSVDPDDVTRKAISETGASEVLYGAPILPGAMTLLAKINEVDIMGVPACALYHKITSFDLLLPRILAGVAINRSDLAELGHGAFCRECQTCVYPKCSFGA